MLQPTLQPRACGLQPAIFLRAEWRQLVLFNFEVERELLAPFAPRGTEIDLFNGRAFVSIVAFKFLRAALRGIPIPFHRDFEEVNLRFYVRRAGDADRRGVVFIREIAPRRMVSFVARRVFNENYVTLPMRHEIRETPGAADEAVELVYAWKHAGRWHRLSARGAGDWHVPEPGSVEHFLIEHHWGYSRQPDGGCMEYRVDHPSWSVRPAIEHGLGAEVPAFYGGPWAECLSRLPHSVLLADGSPVAVRRGVRL